MSDLTVSDIVTELENALMSESWECPYCESSSRWDNDSESKVMYHERSCHLIKFSDKIKFLDEKPPEYPRELLGPSTSGGDFRCATGVIAESEGIRVGIENTEDECNKQ